MILDNLTRALKTQNWLAAGIEFVIVVCGLFVGLQLQNWNEARLNRVEAVRVEQEALTRLLAEAEINVAELRSEQLFFRSLGAYREAFAAYLSPAIDVAPDEAVLRIGHRAMTFSRPIRLADTVFDELSADGGLRAIQDPEIRADLAQFRSAAEFYRGTITGESPDLNAVRERLFPHARLVFDPDGAEDFSMRERFRYVIDWEAMRADPRAVEAVNRALSVQILYVDRLDSLLADGERVCERLAAALDRACEPPAVSEDWVEDLPEFTSEPVP